MKGFLAHALGREGEYRSDVRVPLTTGLPNNTSGSEVMVLLQSISITRSFLM